MPRRPAADRPAAADATPPPADQRPSKTQLKKAMHDLQDLGEALLALPDTKLQALALPARLHDALQELRRTRSHEGRRRQRQYVGKLMRGVDPAPLREAVAAQGLGGARAALALHEAEHWRGRLLASDDALTQWLQQHPGADAQALRTLIRNARREAAAADAQARPGVGVRKGHAYRELFRAVAQALGAAGGATGPADDEPEDDDDE